MKMNIKLIISGILSLFILFYILNSSDLGNYPTENIVLNISNNNLIAKKIFFYDYGCYKLYSNNSYFIIYPVEYLLNSDVVSEEYINTSEVIVCNVNLVYNKTLEICLPPPKVCPMLCSIEGCYPCDQTCYNRTFYIRISNPVIIVEKEYFTYKFSIKNIYIINYKNNLYCIGECKLNKIKLHDDYLYNIISEIINNMPIIRI
jgi:hypothetical protein